MTARWEPLETAEEVVAAWKAGRVIQHQPVGRLDWLALNPSANERNLRAFWSTGDDFRALIEESK